MSSDIETVKIPNFLVGNLMGTLHELRKKQDKEQINTGRTLVVGSFFLICIFPCSSILMNQLAQFSVLLEVINAKNF